MLIKWEYKLHVWQKFTPEDRERELRVLGDAGWELVAIDGRHWGYFKRPVESEEGADFLRWALDGVSAHRLAEMVAESPVIEDYVEGLRSLARWETDGGKTP